jgi:acetoin utilization deacetylase AcuC-like enzyme
LFVKRVGLVLDARFRLHDTGPLHPERPARIDAITAGLEAGGRMQELERIEPAPIDETLLCQVHDRGYVDRVRTACLEGRSYIDTPDSAIGRRSFEIGLLAAGGVVEAARRIGSGVLSRAFCAVRPPGHHAERDRSMGFCLFNNVVLAAHVLRNEFAMKPLAIVDWDVHHGNGTQHLLERDPHVLFVSLHGHPDTLYPGTGHAHEVGVDDGRGTTLNLPFPPGATDADYRAAFEQQVLPALTAHRPHVLLISAGFDAHADDPLADMRLSDEAFAWMLAQLLDIARQHAQGRVLSVLEGGYNLHVLRRCAAEHVAGMLDWAW